MSTTVPVELYRTIERANAAAKAAATATAPGAAFGARRLTAAGLVEELWELWGDGRVLVSAEERSLLAARTASTCDAAAASERHRCWRLLPPSTRPLSPTRELFPLRS
ncbi:MAG: hypothetical protein ACLSGS_05380 [Adlercreutzia sp.]